MKCKNCTAPIEGNGHGAYWHNINPKYEHYCYHPEPANEANRCAKDDLKPSPHYCPAGKVECKRFDRKSTDPQKWVGHCQIDSLRGMAIDSTDTQCPRPAMIQKIESKAELIAGEVFPVLNDELDFYAKELKDRLIAACRKHGVE